MDVSGLSILRTRRSDQQQTTHIHTMGIFSTEPIAAMIDKYERLSDVTKVSSINAPSRERS